MVTDILDKQTQQPVEEIHLDIKVLRTKEQKEKECAHDLDGYNSCCKSCKGDDIVCLWVHEVINDAGTSYIVPGDKGGIEPLVTFLEHSLEIKTTDNQNE